MSEIREVAYKRAAELYADALRTGGAALDALGTSGYHLRPTPQEFHANVLAVAEFLVAADEDNPPRPESEAAAVVGMLEEGR